MYKAIPFIIFKDNKYVVHDEAVNFLGNLKKGIGIVSIAGKYRTGKSFFLNHCVLNEPFERGFNVGSTIQACTKGIWLYTKTLNCVNDRGDVFEALVMDTEGIGALDADNTHDSRIFSLALLLSSFFIYNSSGSIDESAVSSLSLVSNISKHIQIHSGKEASVEELGEYFPHFMWVVRDFSLRLVNAYGKQIESDEYLEDALKGNDNTREVIRTSFPNRQCVTMVRPCVDENDLQLIDKEDVKLRPAFVKQMTDIRQLIYAKVPVKRVFGKVINGPMLTELSKCYVNAINEGVAPVIKDSWELLSEIQCGQVLDEAVEIFETCLAESGINVLPVDELECLIDSWVHTSIKHFEQNSTEGFRARYLDKLNGVLSSRKTSIHKTNLAAVEKLLYQIIHRMNDAMGEITRVSDAEKVYQQFRTEVIQQVGNRWDSHWKCLVVDSIWTWMKSINRHIEDTREKLELSLKNIDVVNNELENCKQQLVKTTQGRHDLFAEFQMKMKQNDESKAILEKQVCEQSNMLQVVKIELEASKQTQLDKDKQELCKIHEESMRLVDEYEQKLSDLNIRLRLSEDINKELDLKVISFVKSENSLHDSIRCLEMKVHDQEGLMLEIDNLRNELGESENKTSILEVEMAKQETYFETQIKELNQSTSDILSDVRNTSLRQRTELSEEISTLKSYNKKLEEVNKHIVDNHATEIRILKSRIEEGEMVEKEMTERYKRETESSRQELKRMSEQWENQNESHRDIVKLLETHWVDEVNNKRKELEDLRTRRKSEKSELQKRLRCAETELVSQRTILKDNKRKLIDAEDRDVDKKLKMEHEEVKSKFAKATVQLDLLKKSDREVQINIKELRMTNLKLERQCKDIQRQREVDLLQLRLEYERQISKT